MMAVMVLSQHRVSTSKTVSPRIPVGARYTGHVGVALGQRPMLLIVLL